MGRPITKIEALNGYKIEELIKLKNNTKFKYTRLVLTAITMRYYGCSNEDICKATQLSSATIILYIRNWNRYCFKSLKDNRGGSIPKLDAETIDNLIDIAVNHSPTEFGFSTFIWTCGLLKIYVEQKVSSETIIRILIKNKISYKRAQPKPTKADIEEQNEFKKMLSLLPILESSSDTIVYALDETGISVESGNHSSWSPVGYPPILEKNAPHEGVNL